MPLETSASAAYTVNVGAIGIIGTFIGMPIDALVLGAMAGAVMHGLNKTSSRANGMITVLTSTLIAGAFSPAVLGYAVRLLDLGDDAAEAEMLRPLVPFVLGGAWPWLLPLISDGLKRAWAVVLDKWLALIGGKK